MLIEFASVVDALHYETEWQRGIAERDAGTADNRFEFRKGINVGDVVVEDGDIYGDGVNVSARLEGLAKPGGICVVQDRNFIYMTSSVRTPQWARERTSDEPKRVVRDGGKSSGIFLTASG
jgi:hypothetical protein